MIFAILAISGAVGLFFNGGHFPRIDALRDGVKEHVKDETRQLKALAALDVAEIHIKTGMEQQKAFANEVVETLSRPDATDEELASVLARVDGVEIDAFNTLLEVRRRLANNTTPAEWALLFPAPTPETE